MYFIKCAYLRVSQCSLRFGTPREFFVEVKKLYHCQKYKAVDQSPDPMSRISNT